jgi:hypothetical protein
MKRNFWILLAVCFFVIGLPFAALAEEGVTDNTIRIGQCGPQTPRSWELLPAGLFQMINDERGIAAAD